MQAASGEEVLQFTVLYNVDWAVAFCNPLDKVGTE